VPKQPIIEHDADEPPRDRTGNWPYWGAFLALAFIWIATLATKTLDWQSFALGGSSGLFLGIWGISVTGNKLPRWMR